VKRARDADDRRLVLVEPVPARIAGARVVFSSTAESLAKLFECYSVRDLAVIADFLQRNADRLRDETRKLAESPVNDLEISPRSKKLKAPVDPVRAGSSPLRNEAPGRRDRKASG
jgi:hypothetical protein